MPQQRMDIRMIKDILRLKFQGGLSHERIAQSLGVSKGAVAKYLSLAGGAGLPPRQNGCRLFRSCIFGSGTHVVDAGCGACGRRLARWSTRSVVHGKPAGARSASSTNPQPDAALLSVRIPGTCCNQQGVLKSTVSAIRFVNCASGCTNSASAGKLTTRGARAGSLRAGL